MKELTAGEALSFITLNSNNKKFHIIDVRNSINYKINHINGAINIDAYDINAIKKISKLKKEHLYFLYCEEGVRSQMAAKFMEKSGFLSIFTLKNGLSEWRLLNLPLF